MQPRILQIGRDQVLLETRGAVLRQAGFSVEDCLVIRHSESMHACLDRFFQDCKIDAPELNALMLCHTLASEQATAIAREARCDAPALRVIVLERSENTRMPSELYDAALCSKDGPGAMVSNITALFRLELSPTPLRA